MFFDLCFLGLPMGAAVLLGTHAKQTSDMRYWRACGCLGAYCIYYLAGGRETLVYLTVAAMMGAGVVLGGAGQAPGI